MSNHYVRIVPMKGLFIVCHLMFFTLLSFAQSGEFHSLGWNDQGRFGWYETGEDNRGHYYRFQIVDLVTDEVLLEEQVYNRQSSPEVLENEIKERYRSQLSLYKLASPGKGTPFSGGAFQSQGYSFSLLPATVEGKVALRILNLTSNNYKDIGILTSSSVEIFGGEISPYEKRAALIWRDSESGEFRVYGAHLFLGFQVNSYQAGELIEAVLCGQYYITRQILDRGVDIEEPDHRGYSPLLLAARNGKWAIAKLLVERGARTDVQDGEGNTPRDYALAAGQRELAGLLR